MRRKIGPGNGSCRNLLILSRWVRRNRMHLSEMRFDRWQAVIHSVAERQLVSMRSQLFTIGLE